MNIYCKSAFLFLFGLFINLSLSTEAVATIEFYLSSYDTKQKVDCDFLEIKNNQALCTVNDLLITYDLARIKVIEVVNNGTLSSFLLFTEETNNIINDLNSNNLAIDSFSDFAQKSVDYFKHQGDSSSTFSTILSISGFVVFLIGSFGFLIATFRAGIVWGLSCMFLPIVSFIFLFVHWKTAAKPFLVILLGITILFLGTSFTPTSQNAQNISNLTSPVARDKKINQNGIFQCNGKIYCSEMSSCAEAKFYLRNCPGTKMDGNNDGIPCEKQWCGH